MSNFEKLENGELKFSLVVPAEIFEQGMEAAYKKNRGNYSVPGFRKGKAPRKMIEKNYGDSVFLEPAFEEVYWEPYAKAVEGSGEQPVDRPSLEIESIGVGEELRFTATVPVKPEIEVSPEQYEGIELTKIDSKITDEQVDREISNEQERQARYTTVERPIVEGDRVVFDFLGKVDDVPFEGGAAENHTLDIGSGQFIPGFEEQMIGLKPGEVSDLNVKFPEEYQAENLAGKDAVFTVTIHEIKEKEVPELDDEFAKDVSEFDTFKEYRDDIKEKMQKSADDNKRREERNEAATVLAQSIPFDMPEVMIDNQVNQMLENMYYQLQRQGISLEQYLGYLGMDVEAARLQMRPDAEKQVRSDLILEGVIRTEKIEPSESDIDEEIAKLAESIQKTPEEAREMIGESNMKNLKRDLAERKAMDLVVEKAKFVTPEKKAKDAEKEAKKMAKAAEKAVKDVEKATKKIVKEELAEESDDQ